MEELKMGTLTGVLKSIDKKYFTLEMKIKNQMVERRLHLDNNHSWEQFNISEGDTITVQLHPIEQNAVVKIIK